MRIERSEKKDIPYIPTIFKLHPTVIHHFVCTSGRVTSPRLEKTEDEKLRAENGMMLEYPRCADLWEMNRKNVRLDHYEDIRMSRHLLSVLK